MAWILIVDDNPDWRKTLRGLLADEGYQIITAEDEAEALAAAVQTSFDLAIIDVRLHGDAADDESGLSLAQSLKRIAPHMKVVLLTGYQARADQVVKSIKFLGVEDFIEKSSVGGGGGVELAAMVKKILDRPSFEHELDQLSLSFEQGQPILVRTRGAHVRALRTIKVSQLSVPSYNRRAQEARGAPDPRFNVKVIGEDLYRDIFESHQEVLSTFEDARVGSEPLCLSFEGGRDFVGVPFEFIFLDRPAEYLVLEHPVSRFINGVGRKRKALSPQTFAQLGSELRVLIVASNTEPPIPGVDQEAQQLADFLKQQGYVNVQVDLIPTEEATITRIRKELRSCQADIFHYAGHGSYNELSPEESTLFFWSEESHRGPVEIMSAAELKSLLQDTEVRLAYFSCCDGVTTGSQPKLLDDDFLGVADAVIQSGVPSALGFRWPVSDVGAPELALAFYGSLLRQGSPEIALWEARRELAGLNRNDPIWLSPILIHQA
jgi:ActR/RegA family two-component response regulator